MGLFSVEVEVEAGREMSQSLIVRSKDPEATQDCFELGEGLMV